MSNEQAQMDAKSRVTCMSSRFGEMWVTLPCNEVGDFKTRRGLHMKLVMEQLQDAITEDGHEDVAKEIGMAVLGLIEAAQREEKNVMEQGSR